MNDLFLPPERLVAPEFVIRSYLPGDGRKTHETSQESFAEVDRYLRWARDFDTPEKAELQIRAYRAAYLKNEDFRVSVWSPDESEQWGGTGFRMKEGPYTKGVAEISMWIRTSEAGRGLATAVLQAMCEWGFTEWGWRRLVWRAHIDNVGSSRVAEKCGFHLSGTFRRRYTNPNIGEPGTMVYYDLLRSEWEAMREQDSGNRNGKA